MGPDGAVNIIFADAIRKSKEPEKEGTRLVDEYRKTFANPWKVAELGYIDDIIMLEGHAPASRRRA
jgi:acetyl-CoA carboxylase carboxyltransferase component